MISKNLRSRTRNATVAVWATTLAAAALAVPAAAVPDDGVGLDMRGEVSEKTIILPDGTEAVAGELLVNYRVDVSDSVRSDLRRRTDVELGQNYPELHVEAVDVEKNGTTLQQLATKKARIEADPAVESVDYNRVRRIAWSPDDELFRKGEQDNLKAVDAPQAWDISRGANVRVAVLDTGCFAGHPELDGGKVAAQTDVYYGDGVADDRNGHGTHVASVLAADTNNRLGIAGAAPEAKVLCAKVLSDSGTGNTRTLLAGLRWARDNGARVVNLSVVGGGYQESEARAFRDLHAGGIFVAAAAGNEYSYRKAVYPAAYPGVTAVTATRRDGTGRWVSGRYGSNRGPYIDVAAPGGSIWGAGVGKPRYRQQSGTSLATPHVSAGAALLAAEGAGSAEITTAIRGAAVDRGANGRDDVFGYGLVNYAAALHSVRR